jgi:succinoglycan biosynthesis transport protein ExoP
VSPETLPNSAIENEASGSIGAQITRITGFLRRRYRGIAVCFILCLPLGALFYVFAPRSYTASTVMLIDTDKGPLSDPSQSVALRDAAWIESQIGVLKSQNVAAYVVKQLRLGEDAKFLQENTGLVDKLLARLDWRDAMPKSEAERNAVATGAVMDGLQARRAGVSYMISIDVRASDANYAVKIANTMVDAYIFDQLNAKYQSNRRAGDWLQERLQSLREQSAAAERAAIDFKAKNHIVTAGGALMNEKQLSDSSGQLASVRAHVSDLQTRLNRISAVRAAYQEDQPSSGMDENVTEAMNNGIIARLRSQYLDLVNREADWSVRYGKNHQAVINLRNQIRDIRKSIRDELGRIEQTIKSEFEIAEKQQDDAEKAVTNLVSQSTATNQAQVTLFSLEATAKSYRKLYDSFLQRHAETVQQQTLPMTDARMLSPAGISKSSPQFLQISLMTVLGGMMAGVGFGVLRELLDRGFRTRDQVRSVLGVECLALVPILPKKAFRLLRGDQLKAPTEIGRGALPWTVPAQRDMSVSARRDIRSVRSEGKVWRHVVDAPASPGAEALRSLNMTLDLNAVADADKTIGITSCLPGEGKTTIAAAMAATIAQTGRSVILVDCDLRNPSLSRSLAPDARVGFFEVVERQVRLADAVWNDPGSKFDFLPAVMDPRVPPRVDILTSGAAGSFFDELRKVYDCVLVDLPPLVAGIDVRATVRHLTSSILIVEWGSTKIDQVEYALRHAKEFKDTIAGVVLNKVDMTAMGLYDSYGAQYYYGRPRHTVN